MLSSKLPVDPSLSLPLCIRVLPTCPMCQHRAPSGGTGCPGLCGQPASPGLPHSAGPAALMIFLSHNSDGDTDSVSTMVVHDVEETAGTQTPYGGGTMVVQRVSGFPQPFQILPCSCLALAPSPSSLSTFRPLRRSATCCTLTAMATQTSQMWYSPATRPLRAAKGRVPPPRTEAVM